MSWHDPETRSVLNDRKTQRDNEWLKGQIGNDTYLRSLMILGYLEKDARVELNLLRMEVRR